MRKFGYRNLARVSNCYAACGAGDILVIPGLSGQLGGRVVYGERSEPKTLNPIFAPDTPSRNIANRLMADLVHINRATLKTEPALAKSCKVFSGGLRYELELRQNLKFSDGHPFDADDVIFTFQVYLDENVHAPQRGFWISTVNQSGYGRSTAIVSL